MSPTPLHTIGTRPLEMGEPPYVIAEIGVNFDGNLHLAERSIAAAAACGVDAVKFQTFRAEEFVADPALTYTYDTAGGPVTENALAMFRRLELPVAWHERLKTYAEAQGVAFLSSSADPSSIDLLLGLGVPALKLASEDLVNRPLLRHAAARGASVILSTGMADEQEIDEAVMILGPQCPLMLLHCVSLYPAPDDALNLRRMVRLAERYGLPVGYSDHSLGVEAAVAATALGARLIEKHFTIDRNLPGPDHRFSADPAEMAALVAAVRRTARQLGTGALAPSDGELVARRDFRRSIVAACAVPAGTVLEPAMLALKRPHTGLHPRELDRLMGRRTRRLLLPDQQLTWNDVE